MTEIPDNVAAVVQLLIDAVGVNELCEGRVQGGELPESLTTSMPQYVVVVRPSGGVQAFGTAYQEYGDSRLDVLCYGATPQQAHKLYRRVHPVLKHLRRQAVNGCLLHWARTAGGPFQLREQDTSWPFTFSSWQVLAAEVAVA